MKVVRIFLLVLIIIGIGLLFTQRFWVPPLVQVILAHETPAYTIAPVASTTAPAPRPGKVDTGVEGIVTLGPTCPVERNPPDPACADKPYPTTLVISGKGRNITVKTDAQGHFSQALAPGDYVIRAQSQSTLPRLSPVTFSVTPGTLSSLNLQFDSGIR